MSKLQEIKDVQLAARKAKNQVESSLLTTIIGEAAMVGKSAGNRESTDAEVIAVLKKFEKNLLEVIELTKNAQANSVVHYRKELEILQRFLPAKLSDEQVLDDIKFVIGAKGLTLEQKSLGIITKALKEKYGDQFDGQQVSNVFKTFL